MINKHELKRTSLYSNGLMLLTTLHHIYGAVLYSTPWRLHVLLISMPAIILTTMLSKFLVKYENNRYVFGCYWLLVLIPSIGLIGLFEGMYNHLLKNLMFFSGTSKEVLIKMFPPPTYELPNNFFFEFTGVLQAVVVVFLIISFVRLTRTFCRKTNVTAAHR
jgi:hypothetical protein